MARSFFKLDTVVARYIFCITIWLFGISLSSQVSFMEDVTLSQNQRLQLNEFKSLVGSKLPHDYMREDIYLVRWLRARDYNLKAATTMLMENLKWREENDMDNILNEDWSDFERDYRFGVEGCDFEGRPVVSLYVGDWDVRKAVIAGQSQKLMRYFDKLFEEVTLYIRRAQDQGKNVSQYVEIYDMSQYNLRQQGCPLCVPIYIYLFQSWENHFPGVVNKVFLLNTPAIFESLWQILKPLLSEGTRNSIQIYGRDKKEWQPLLLKEIHRSQLTVEFGGTNEIPLEVEEIRNKPNGTFRCVD